MKLKKLLKDVEILKLQGQTELEISKVCYNSQEVVPGSVFVANKGFVTDGHKYIPAAIEAGAVAIVDSVDQGLEGVTEITVADTRQTLARMACQFYDHPSKKMTLVGITATNGKTSTSMMLDAIFQYAGIQNGLIGTVYYRFGDQMEAAILTTPESVDLQDYFAQMVDKGTDTCVMEVSSAALDMSRVEGVDFDIIAMNNISKEHIQEHGSFENYWKAKQTLVTGAKPDAYVIINRDDPHVSSLEDKTQGQVITFSEQDRSADLFVRDVDLKTGFPKFTIDVNRAFTTRHGLAQTGSFDFELHVAGYHSVYNAMSAIGIAMAYGLPMETIQKGIASFYGIERRFQQIFKDRFQVFDDHFANARNIEVTLKTLTKIDYKRLRMVYAIRGNRGLDVNGEALDELAKWIKDLRVASFFATKSLDSTGLKDRVSPEEEDLFLEKMKGMDQAYTFYDNLADAVKAGLDSAEAGDLVLFAGCQGMDFGAKFALDYIQKAHPDWDVQLLEDVLAVRVAGV